MMRHWQYVLTIGFGALLAVVAYFKMAMGHSQQFSHFAFARVADIGLLGIPSMVVAMNMRTWSIGSVALSVVFAALMMFWLFVMDFGAGMPGTEWIDDGMMNGILLLPTLSVAVLAFRFIQAIPTLLISAVVCFSVLSFGLPVYMRQVLGDQMAQTLASGGCVLTGQSAKNKIQRADQIRLGWFVGTRSDQVYFVEGPKYFKWSYANFGLDTRRNKPRSFPITTDMNCSSGSITIIQGPKITR